MILKITLTNPQLGKTPKLLPVLFTNWPTVSGYMVIYRIRSMGIL
jgi:hypothetical protein